jgi:hypothetical protein
MSDEAKQQLKSAGLDIQITTKEQRQSCLDALGEKMKAAAKEDPRSKAGDDTADSQASAAEATADRLVADLEAGNTFGDDVESSTRNVSDEEWNEMLGSYTSYVNQYATLMKKSAKGDMSAMSESAGIIARSQELEEQLKEYAGKATPAPNAK